MLESHFPQITDAHGLLKCSLLSPETVLNRCVCLLMRSCLYEILPSLQTFSEYVISPDIQNTERQRKDMDCHLFSFISCFFFFFFLFQETKFQRGICSRPFDQREGSLQNMCLLSSQPFLVTCVLAHTDKNEYNWSKRLFHFITLI